MESEIDKTRCKKMLSIGWRSSVFVCLLTVTIGLLGACSRTVPQANTPVPTSSGGNATDATQPPVLSSASSIQALGIVQPLTALNLSFGVNGKIDILEVRVGTVVQSGDVLAELDTANLEFALRKAEAQVRIHELELEELRNISKMPETLRATSENEFDIGQAELSLQIKELQLKEALASKLPDPTKTQIQRYAEDARISVMEVEVNAAKLELQNLRGWTNPFLDDKSNQIEQAETRLLQALIEMEELMVQIESATIVAPFDGIISAIDINVGEFSNAGSPVLTIIDNSHWYVETENVSELDIGKIQVGHDVNVRVVSFNTENLSGEVVEISPVAVVQQGDTTYSLRIKLEGTDLALLPGMNSSVDILLE